MRQPKDYGFGSDETILRDSARRFLDEAAPIERVRRLVAPSPEQVYESEVPPAAWDESVWRRMVELGWTSLAVPEEAGGAGLRCAAVAALAEEIGRHALPSPLPATLAATYVLREAGEAARPWLEKIAGGASATVAIASEDGAWESGETGVRARASGRGAVLDGQAWFVQDVRKCSLVIVAAREANGVALYAVATDAPGVTIRPDHLVDLTRDQARVSFEGVEVPAEGVLAGDGGAALRRALPPILTITAADAAGAGEWQLRTTAEYAKVRHQFDRPLGFFQAVKHPIVNMMIAVDETRSLVYNAAAAIDAEPEAAERAARIAKASAAETAAFCSSRSVQLHGGIGFTWEADLHVYFKRQKHTQMLWGDGVHHRRKIAELL